MENYIEAYGAIFNKCVFLALRFKENTPVFNTANNQSVILSSKRKSKDKLVITLHPEILLSVLHRSNVFHYRYYKYVLYVCGKNPITPLPYESTCRTPTFKALYRVIKAVMRQNVMIQHYALCYHFKRNHVQWKSWQSWWAFIVSLLNPYYLQKTGCRLTLQRCKHLKKVYQYSNIVVQDPYVSSLRFCELSLDESNDVGVLCAQDNHSKIIYVSPMIVSEQFQGQSIQDVNHTVCTLWFPLYIDREHWFNKGIYFYTTHYNIQMGHLQNMLIFLQNTTVEKYQLIQENLMWIYKLLTYQEYPK